MSLIPRYFLDTVAALGAPDPTRNDDICYFATAFVFGYPVSPPTNYRVFVVTNRPRCRGSVGGARAP